MRDITSRSRGIRRWRGGAASLTIFSIPKPFVGHIGLIQRNAITSWTLIRPRPEIILLGDEEGTAKIADELGLVHIPAIECNVWGTPLISSAFANIQACSKHKTLCYINCDIILLPRFTEVFICARKFSRFLVIGRRTNLWVREPIDFSVNDWDTSLCQLIDREGVLHSHWGIDYFVFPRNLWRQVPPFAIGRLMWDNWLIYDARRRRIPVIDATSVVKAVHQNHSVTSNIMLPSGDWDWSHPEVQSNLALAGGPNCSYNVYDSTWVLRHDGIFPAAGEEYRQQRRSRSSASRK